MSRVRILTESGIERIFQPFCIEALCVIHQHYIEAAWRNALQAGEIVLRGADQTLLLVAINARGRSAETGVAALAYFDKDQCDAILHDQVNLAETAAIILRYRLESPPL